VLERGKKRAKVADFGSAVQFETKVMMSKDATPSRKRSRSAVSALVAAAKSSRVRLSKGPLAAEARLQDRGVPGDGDAQLVIQKISKDITDGTGTLLWMAPELLEQLGNGKQIPYGPEVDIFSFGMILYEAVELNRPWHQHKSQFSYMIADLAMAGKRPSVSTRGRDGAPVGYMALMRACWDQHPSSRPAINKVACTLQDMQLRVCGLDSAGRMPACQQDSQIPTCQAKPRNTKMEVPPTSPRLHISASAPFTSPFTRWQQQHRSSLPGKSIELRTKGWTELQDSGKCVSTM